ncbi:MAG: bifunctional folylpolyglutamate synthase/dihydrofolate synthase [Paracoccaceae bacterium]|nr:bifunctional folylpolyglutamate synthase/dihydrofolate synthase [Paracoccaceae bacterium]
MTVLTSDIVLERMMSLHPRVIDLTLDRVWGLLEAIGSPEKTLPPVIHIAGTNGKGSTQAMLRAGLEANGHRVHAYTSPHIERFHERIMLAGALIKEEHLTAILDECYLANGPDSITYFEITTCAALLAMSRSQADYTLLEVGLGGRLDATNVIERPALCIITPVSIDHEQFLGNTVSKIAQEKAGIIKKGVPVVVGPQLEDAMQVIEDIASLRHAPLLAYGQHWHVSRERDRVIYQDETGLLDLPLPILPGAHQIENAGAAVAALRHLDMPQQATEHALTNASWPARMQRLKQGALANLAGQAELWLDGGHNAAAGIALANHLATLPKRPTFLICGMLNTKDILGYLSPLAKQADKLIAVSIPNETNTLPAEVTATQASNAGLTATSAVNVARAIQEIVQVEPYSRILICGSLYLAGAVLRENK